MTKDLTRGRPMTLLLQFGIPVLFGLLFQQLYNVVDTAIVGKFLGGQALAAVGSTGSINFLVVGGCIGLCSGFAIPVAQCFGAGDFSGLRKYAAGALWCCVFFSVVITAATLLFGRAILSLMQTPADIYESAWIYIRTIFAGIPGYILYNMTAGILRSLGDSRTPVIWLVAASLTNIVLDLVLIINFGLGVFGAAFATIFSQFLAGFGCLFRVCRGFDVLRMERGDWAWSWQRIGRLMMLGLPMGLQYSITAIGSVILQSAVNVLGTTYVTATTAAQKVSLFLACPFDAMGSTMVTYGGQNVGAGAWKRLHQGVRACTILGVIYALIAMVSVRLAGHWMVMLFLDAGSADLAPLAQHFLWILVVFYIPLALVNIFRFMIQGMGFSPLATFAGVLEMIGRIAVARLVGVYGYAAACYASPAAWILADCFLVPAYFVCARRIRRRIEAAGTEKPEEAVSAARE